MALFMFTKNILEGKPIDIYNYGRHKRDFTYIDDIVEGVVLTLDNVATPNPNWSGDQPDQPPAKRHTALQYSNNQPVELMRFVEVLEQCLGMAAEKNFLPMQLGDVLKPMPTWMPSCRMLVRSQTSIETGIKRFVEWYKNYYSIA